MSIKCGVCNGDGLHADCNGITNTEQCNACGGTGVVTRPQRTPITHVAIRFEDITYSLPAPKRHHDVIMKIVTERGVRYVDSRDEDQGFLDASGRYLTRKQALMSALLHKQVKDESKIRLNMLFSEYIW